MYSPIVEDRKKTARRSSLEFYHNAPFPLEEVIDVLYPSFGPQYPYNDFLRMIYDAHHIFCAFDERENRPIACGLVNEVNDKGGLYVMLFGVRPSSQGRGAGTFLLKRILDWSSQRGYTYIYLHVHIENHAAIGLYEKVGFRKQELIWNFYSATPKANPHGYRMILSL